MSKLKCEIRENCIWILEYFWCENKVQRVGRLILSPILLAFVLLLTPLFLFCFILWILGLFEGCGNY
jgi:hypothetical protein